MFYIPQENEADRQRRERMRRRSSGEWIRRPWAQDEDNEVLEKQGRDLRDDLETATESGGAKSATAADVSRVEQSRAKGQRFRADEHPRRVQISTAIESGDDHDFLEGEEGAERWNKSRKL